MTTLQVEIYSTTPLHRPEWESCCFDIVRASSDWSWLAFFVKKFAALQLPSLVETWVGTDLFNKPAWETGLQPTGYLYKNSFNPTWVNFAGHCSFVQESSEYAVVEH
jgi:hypothetical protein